MKEYDNYLRVLEYVDDVLTGRKIACKEVIFACARFRRDLKSEKYDFDTKTPEFVIRLIESTFRHVKGKLKGQLFKFEPWQLFIVYNLLGFLIKGTNERRFKEAFIFIPRKNGKTTFVAALAWALGILERLEGSTLYIVGSVLKQALESFNILKKNVPINEFRILDNNNEHSISKSFYNERGIEIGSIHIEALASNPDAQDGYNCNIAILDEIHAYKDSNQYYVIRQGMKAFFNKLLIGITTAGKTMNSFCYDRLQYCTKVLNQEVDDEQYFIFIAKADDPEDYANPVEHEKANPNYGVTIKPEEILAEAVQAQNDVSSRTQFLNKSLNIYTNTMDAYFDIFVVQASDESHNFTLEELLKLNITWYGGADLSKMYDLTAASLYGRYKDIDIVITHGFIPVTEAQRKADEDNIPFFWWKDQGWLTMCNQEVVDYEDVVKWFISMRDLGFKIKSVGFDKYNSREFVRSMKAKRFKMNNISQQYWVKSEAFRIIEQKIKLKLFYYLHNKAFEYCISNVKAMEDSEERVKFEKLSDNYRIDLFDASVIACKEMINDLDKTIKSGEWFNRG